MRRLIVLQFCLHLSLLLSVSKHILGIASVCSLWTTWIIWTFKFCKLMYVLFLFPMIVIQITTFYFYKIILIVNFLIKFYSHAAKILLNALPISPPYRKYQKPNSVFFFKKLCSILNFYNALELYSLLFLFYSLCYNL